MIVPETLSIKSYRLAELCTQGSLGILASPKNSFSPGTIPHISCCQEEERQATSSAREELHVRNVYFLPLGQSLTYQLCLSYDQHNDGHSHVLLSLALIFL